METTRQKVLEVHRRLKDLSELVVQIAGEAAFSEYAETLAEGVNDALMSAVLLEEELAKGKGGDAHV